METALYHFYNGRSPGLKLNYPRQIRDFGEKRYSAPDIVRNPPHRKPRESSRGIFETKQSVVTRIKERCSMPRIVDKKAKRQKLMETALELFISKGYKSVTTREIAEKAGVSKGVLYDYFANKEDLFIRTIREHSPKKLIYKSLEHNKDLSPRQRYRKFPDLVIRYIEMRKQRFHMMFDFVINCPDRSLVCEVMGSVYEQVREHARIMLSEAFPHLSENGSLDLYVNIYISFLDGIFIQHLFDPERTRLKDCITLFWRIMTRELEEQESPTLVSAQ